MGILGEGGACSQELEDSRQARLLSPLHCFSQGARICERSHDFANMQSNPAHLTSGTANCQMLIDYR